MLETKCKILLIDDQPGRIVKKQNGSIDSQHSGGRIFFLRELCDNFNKKNTNKTMVLLSPITKLDEFKKDKVEQADVILVDYFLNWTDKNKKEIHGDWVIQTISNEWKLINKELILFSEKLNADQAFKYVKEHGLTYFIKEPSINQLEHLKKLDSLREQFKFTVLKATLEVFQRKEVEKFIQENIIGESPAFQEIIKTIENVAKFDVPILIIGETGVGKEKVARAIHKKSGRKGNFITVNCGAIPDTLIEVELFGYIKDAFTGANKTKNGLFQEAHRGTLFLDEIGEASPLMQVKLLRAIQEKQVRKVGSVKEDKVDVRIICATNKYINNPEVRKSGFREDLYQRISTFIIHVPPLRERPDDIPHLSDYFIKEMEQKYRKNITINDKAKEYLKELKWPGNVRDLEKILRRAVAYKFRDSNITITKDDIQKAIDSESAGFPSYGEGGSSVSTQIISKPDSNVIKGSSEKLLRELLESKAPDDLIEYFAQVKGKKFKEKESLLKLNINKIKSLEKRAAEILFCKKANHNKTKLAKLIRPSTRSQNLYNLKHLNATLLKCKWCK